MKRFRHIVGIDEAGRGPLAGRLFVGAVLLPYHHMDLIASAPMPLADSKRLSPSARHLWMKWIKENNIPFVYSAVGPSVIDRINIYNAVHRGAARALDRLLTKAEADTADVYCVTDRGMRLSDDSGVHYESVLKADEHIPAVALASIVAKVHRDQEMERMHNLYPQYGFCNHKGYGTQEHKRSLKVHGPCAIHRRSFIRWIEND